MAFWVLHQNKPLKALVTIVHTKLLKELILYKSSKLWRAYNFEGRHWGSKDTIYLIESIRNEKKMKSLHCHWRWKVIKKQKTQEKQCTSQSWW